MNEELIEKILETFNINYTLEDKGFIVVDGVPYYCCLVEDLRIEAKGKYQNGGAVFSVGTYEREIGYKEIEYPLLYIEQDFTRSGSYYSDWDYEYCKPYVVKKKEVVTTVWEAV